MLEDKKSANPHPKFVRKTLEIVRKCGQGIRTAVVSD